MKRSFVTGCLSSIGCSRIARYGLIWSSVLCLASLWHVERAAAQDPVSLDRPVTDARLADVTPSMSNDLWLYLHEQRRADDPKQAIRRKAELKAEQRRQRLAAMKWYGLSNSRPTATTMPFMGTYSPTWMGNSGLPYGWSSGRNMAPPVATYAWPAAR